MVFQMNAATMNEWARLFLSGDAGEVISDNLGIDYKQKPRKQL